MTEPAAVEAWAATQLSLCADCVEPLSLPCTGGEAPAADGLRGVVAVGLYQLDERRRRRTGAVELFQVCKQAPPAANSKHAGPSVDGFRLGGCGRLSLDAGALDLRWFRPPSRATPSLAAVCADGTLRTFVAELPDADLAHTGWNLREATRLRAFAPGVQPQDVIGVSLDVADCVGSRFAFCTSDGNAFVTSACAGEILHKWQAHQIETWSIAFSPGNADVLASGADDCSIRVWDCRELSGSSLSASSESSAPSARAQATNRKEHTAGVTAVAFDPTRPHRLLSGR
eukprot:GHVT01096659.1.p1 GENE.GHVT01096659.1~~GHVT01096659.1.p1  ORF type:complete len:286 (-),score=81.18 GHVT01096659.1:728-1585(-)